MSRVVAIACLLMFSAVAHAQPEPLVKKVKTSITKGVDYLVKQQRPDGSWEDLKDKNSAGHYGGGPTALAVLALLNCDGVIDDLALNQKRKDAIQQGLANLRKIDSPKVYVRALQTMALAEAKTDLPIVKANVKWLLDARVRKSGQFIGWGYDNRPGTLWSDASNSQYALLALWYARQHGVPIERQVWEEIRDYYTRTQNKDGSWIYTMSEGGPEDEKGPSMTMTVAGMCGLLIAGQELNAGREQWLPNGRAKNCGVYDENEPVAKAQQWLNKRFTIDLEQRAYYHLYGLERAGRLSGNRFFGEHDWYREGCEFLVKKQDPSGVWTSRGGWDRWPHINTSFALLFLSKGRTPVLVSKLVHGKWQNGRDESDNDWNNDRNDLRHLTDYIAKTDLFEKKPIAWQTYDIRRAIEAHLDKNNVLNAEDEAAIVADMRQAPILYITGHKSLLPARLQAVEISLIKRYVENGGFLFAEACCGDPAFDTGFKQWVKDIWDDDLKYIEPTHPVWTCWAEVKPGQPYKLMALNVGCRTALLYSPQDLSCHWESNQHDGAARPAFWLGANIVAYATGRTPPQPRLTPVNIAVDKELKDLGKRGSFQVHQLKHGGPSPAENAMKKLLRHVHETTGLDVVPQPRSLGFVGFESTTRSAKFFYMHGKGDFRVSKENLEPLRFTLTYGGLLFADACCGDKEFDKAFRKFAEDLFPKEKLIRVPADATSRDRLFSAALNGEELSAATKIQCRLKANGQMLPMEPYLEGIRVNGRWVVLYSQYDIGCALERSTSADCVGYDPDSALRIAMAAVRYNTRP